MAISVTAQNRADVSNLYVALFGRAPDGEGLPESEISRLRCARSMGITARSSRRPRQILHRRTDFLRARDLWFDGLSRRG